MDLEVVLRAEVAAILSTKLRVLCFKSFVVDTEQSLVPHVVTVH